MQDCSGICIIYQDSKCNKNVYRGLWPTTMFFYVMTFWLKSLCILHFPGKKKNSFTVPLSQRATYTRAEVQTLSLTVRFIQKAHLEMCSNLLENLNE